MLWCQPWGSLHKRVCNGCGPRALLYTPCFRGPPIRPKLHISTEISRGSDASHLPGEAPATTLFVPFGTLPLLPRFEAACYSMTPRCSSPDMRLKLYRHALVPEKGFGFTMFRSPKRESGDRLAKARTSKQNETLSSAVPPRLRWGYNSGCSSKNSTRTAGTSKSSSKL